MVFELKRLAQCLGALIGNLVAVQGQYLEHGVRLKRIAQCLSTLIGDLVAVQGQDREDGVCILQVPENRQVGGEVRLDHLQDADDAVTIL